ncbi:hypothetical protein SAMN05414137_1366 [Streptacidiphilus jiangxiensis]|uniref:Uncharacterized protein n=2 Tax=Streptacidiphilus jiangxiensis TaxID=235985 RepID=A0A1H7ZK54_STRJI|nr:hypothetical protein SAMN05414137_1366 [Streptacidiphilus jiangxiensis]
MSPWAKAALVGIAVLGVGGTWAGEELAGTRPAAAAQASRSLPQSGGVVQVWLDAGGQARINQFFDGMHDLSVDMYRSATAGKGTGSLDLTTVVADARRIRAQNAADLTAAGSDPVPDAGDERLWSSALTSLDLALDDITAESDDLSAGRDTDAGAKSDAMTGAMHDAVHSFYGLLDALGQPHPTPIS